MIRAVIFGGTVEGRKLCEACSAIELPVAYCVTSPLGAEFVETLPDVHVHVGRLDTAAMTALLGRLSPALVVDATHPYAEEASRNIARACEHVQRPLLRVMRENCLEEGCLYFNTTEAMIAWLENEPGNVFVTMGSSSAPAFSQLTHYKERVWMRILPSLERLGACLDWGYSPQHLICMQGPFSEDLNRAMFQATEAKILVTKNSGSAGGFPEKVRAARKLGMRIGVLLRPEEAKGVSLEEARIKLGELKK